MIILVTNDDGPPSESSPFLLEFLLQLQQNYQDADIYVCVPDTQQSWVSKSISRASTLKATHLHLDGFNGTAYTIQGSPASVTNIALHHILPSAPDLVISGPNFGQNASSGFIQSSGTVGAAMEANLCGYKAIALSFGFGIAPITREDELNACAIGIQVIRRIQQTWNLLDPQTYPDLLWNVNIPLGIRHPVENIAFTSIALGSYGSLYKQSKLDPLSYEYAPSFKFDTNAIKGSDRWALNHMQVSVTPMSSTSRIFSIPVSVSSKICGLSNAETVSL